MGLAGGESGAEYRERVQRAFSKVVDAHVDDGGEVLVVSHGVTIATYLWSVGWETPGALPNASISVVRVPVADGPPQLVAVGLHDLDGVVV
jgi:2,3-bisphosphoglycerate-dependent phosphoglycerate mutase